MRKPLQIRTCLLLLTALCLQFSAYGLAQEKISIHAKKTNIQQVLKQVEQQTDYRFVYSNDIAAMHHPVSIAVDNFTLAQTLGVLFKETPLQYTMKENKLVVVYAQETQETAQPYMVKGTVRDAQGNPLPGVSVRSALSNRSTQTDAQGDFSLASSENDQLEFSFVGFQTRLLQVNGRQQIQVVLQEDSQVLEDVTITGYTRYARELSSSASSEVGAEAINQVPMASLDQILQGRVPGMNVTAGSGQPGSSASVVIRGIGSINGSSAPLFVMDGVPIESNYFQTINPNDVESITVLRDASAKSLYGSRGSNGVVVITTKKGKAGRLSVNYASQYGFSNMTSPKFQMMNSEQRIRFEEEVGLETGRDVGPGWTYSPLNPDYANMSPAEQAQADFIIDSLRNMDVDWRDFFFQQGQFMEQQVSISGGNEKFRFFNSLNYYNQDGIAKRTGMKRLALRSNVDFNSDRFSGNVNVSMGYSKSSFTEGEGGTGVGTSMASVYYALPYEYPYDSRGVLIHPGNETSDILDLREGSVGLERLLNSSDKTEQFKTILGLSLGYQITPELKAITRAGMDYRNSTDQVYINPDSYYGSRRNSTTVGGKGRFGEGIRRNFSLISTSGLTYQNTFEERHDLEFSGFFEYIYDHYKAFNYIGYGLDERLPETPAGISISEEFMPDLGGGRTHSALVSFMGIGRYTFDRKYTLTGSYRYDGSTKVAPENRWHGFYSIGASWNAKAESFLQDKPMVSALNLRGSYGTTASPFSGDFLYLATYSGSTYGGQPAIRPASPGNPAFDWEYVGEFNAGFDLSLFPGERLQIRADYYNRITRNMFIDQPLSATSGFSELSLSTGKMRNRGVEFDVRGTLIDKPDWTFTLGVNGAYNKNTILHLTDLADELMDGDTRILKVGMPYGTYYAPLWAGVNPENGEAQYYTPEGSITTDYNYNTLSVTKSGSLFPAFTGGITAGLRWKNFTADALLSYVGDVMRWNNEDFYNENQRYMGSNQTLRMLEDRWKKPGDQAILQRIDIPRNFTSKDIQNASFLRLRHVRLGYALPKPVLDRIGFIQGLTVFVQGQNLLTWTSWRGLDPENNDVYGRYDYPAARTYTAGLNVNF